ncbi:APC family permease [Acidiphilium sp. AL]|uniref:APC family permease n=1 Tax=Acidiphilium iwatense TaxID=768198 RepID=A0ABS9DV46_9PROT|nr:MULTISPECIES: APC family permease [Acidiphilium]MCF3946603.1 APC family permease [Acidiphilium iwatense]MCU4159929.1 APC family permease [Acidiphilium sp. AL]
MFETNRSNPGKSGYPQELARGLNLIENIALVLSDITPMASLLVIAPVVLSTAGSGAVIAYLLAGFVAINIALCMGELGSVFPVAGGLYSIVTKVLGRPIGFLALLDYIGQAIFLPASIAIGIGTYLHALDAAIPENISSAIAMALITLLAIARITANAIFVSVFLVIEIGVLTFMTVGGLIHVTQPIGILLHPVLLVGQTATASGALHPVTVDAILAALAAALFSVNGYDSAINFSEETKGPAANIGRAVIIACSVGVVFEIIPFVASVFGAPDLKAYLASQTPLTWVIEQVFGTLIASLVLVGAIAAIVNATLAITLQFSRIVWASARDQAWPMPVNRALGKVSRRFHSPWVATLLVGICATILAYQFTLVSVVTFTSVLLVVLYALVAISAIVHRVRSRGEATPFRMPFWPVPPLIALIGSAVTLYEQTYQDILTVVAIFVAGLIYYGLYLGRRGVGYAPSAVPENLP